MFWNLLWIENQKNLRRHLLWVELAILVVFVMFVFTGLYFSIQGTPDGVTITDVDRAKIPELVSWPGSLAFSLRFAAGSKLLLIIFIGAVTASEYGWRTYQMWLSHGVSRTLLLLGKFSAFCVPILIVVIGTLIAGGIISGIFSLHLHGTLHLAEINVVQLGIDVFRTAYTILPYVSITFLLAVATRSAVAAIGGCTAYGLIIESLLDQTLRLLPGKLGKITLYLPSSLMESVLNASGTPSALMDDIVPGLLPVNHAVIVIAIWSLLFFGISLLIFRRQDFSG